MKNYVYIFTRQDISPEQQLVQSAHVALKLGFNAAPWFNTQSTAWLNPDDTYFTVVGVRNLEGLQAAVDILMAYDFKFEAFAEPDIGGELTSVATYPIPEDGRGVLLAFNWLKF